MLLPPPTLRSLKSLRSAAVQAMVFQKFCFSMYKQRFFTGFVFLISQAADMVRVVIEFVGFDSIAESAVNIYQYCKLVRHGV